MSLGLSRRFRPERDLVQKTYSWATFVLGAQRRAAASSLLCSLLLSLGAGLAVSACKPPEGKLASTSSKGHHAPEGPLIPVVTGTPPPPVRIPESEPAFTLIACGEASYYAEEFAGSRTANGETFDPKAKTAAHPSLPFDTRVRVVREGQKPRTSDDGVLVRINDRGPYFGGRIIDLSKAAFAQIIPLSRGYGRVCLYRES